MNKIHNPHPNGLQRIIIERVWPEIDGGRFPIKRCVNDNIIVEATLFADGHDELAAELKFRAATESTWQTSRFKALGNDRWRAEFTVTSVGLYYYTISAWIDHFHSWRRNLSRWVEAQHDVSAELLIGAQLVAAAAQRATGNDAKQLRAYAKTLRTQPPSQATHAALDEALATLMDRYPQQEQLCQYDKQLSVTVDPVRARFGSWYELFPRSTGELGKHGTFASLIKKLPYIAQMGFDVLYLPPIHPVGTTHRKGKNNAPTAQPNEPGSPWGIGSTAGGHMALHPQLGTDADFRALVREAQQLGLEIALDMALQCSPDHPYVQQHPEWFKHRPDGSIRYAENPPKKYQDIYPLDFQSEHWATLWEECKNIILFWIQRGVTIFRVDNPHTKPFVFWQWLIDAIKQQHPEVIFLSEAFTRPNPMYYLAKIGFSQSYTYFTWRNTKAELIEYFTELTQTEVREYFRPNLWPNTPDILHEYLQAGGRPAFIARLVLAATLGASYGIYGPAFELCVNAPREPRSEEYRDSEKYEIKAWNTDDPASLRSLITRINQIRRDNVSLQDDTSLRFHPTDNEQLLCYSKYSAIHNNIIVIVVNLDPHFTQSGWVELPLEHFGINSQESYSVHDLLTDNNYLWHGVRNYVELNPQQLPAHIFRIYPHIHHEQDFYAY